MTDLKIADFIMLPLPAVVNKAAMKTWVWRWLQVLSSQGINFFLHTLMDIS